MRIAKILIFMVVFIISSVSAHSATKPRRCVCYSENILNPVIIVSNEKGNVTLKAAVKDLRDYLGRLTRAKIEILKVAGKGRFPIYIGSVEQNKYLLKSCPKGGAGVDGFALDVAESGIHILGATPEGTAYGIYELLERMGVRWLFPRKYGEVLPEYKKTISLDLGLTIDKPVFAIRQVDSAWAKGLSAWKRRNRNNYSGFGGHNGLGLWKFRKEHPEWFAEINGVRQVKLKNPADFKVCYTNKEMLKQAVAIVLAALEQRKKNPKTQDYFIYSISPTDGGGFCKCEKCRKLGTVSDQVQIYANTLAAAVAKKYPNILLGYYGAYSEHSMPPTVKARDNVIVFMTTWAKALTKKLSSIENKNFRIKVEEFSKKCPKLAIRDYEFLDCWWEKGPYSLIDVHQADYQWYHKHGVKGILTECSDYWEGGAQSNYVMAKLWWNPYADVEKIKRDYVQCGFGKAFAPMWRFHERINKERAFIEESTIINMRHDLEEAAKLSEREDVKTRIDLLRVHYLQLYACSELEMGRASKELLTTALRAGLTYIDAWSATVLKRMVMPKIYRALKKMPGNGEMSKVKYPYTTSEKDILKAMAAAKLEPYTKEELSEVLRNMKIPDSKPPLNKWTAGDDLKLTPLSRGKKEFKTNMGINLRYLSHQFLIYAEPNEIIDITPTNKYAKFPVSYQITSPEMLEVATGEFSGKEPLKFTAGSGGVYKITMKTIGYPSMDVKNRYAVIKASSAQQRMHPLGGLRNHYFYVPKGTREFALVIKGDKGEPYEFILWDSLTQNLKNPLIPRKKYGNTSFMEHRIKVPEGSDGKVWKLWLSGEDMELFIKGIPPFISNSPARLLKK